MNHPAHFALQTPWLTRSTLPAADMTLVCFPYAGGSAASFHGWQDALQPEVDVRCVQLPGRGARWHEAPATDLRQLARTLAATLSGSLQDRPMCFFGHSMGGLLAFEVCRAMALENRRLPAHLFISGCAMPLHREPIPPYHELPDAALLAVLRNYRGTPEAILRNPEAMELLLPAIRADFQMVSEYQLRGRPVLPVPLTVLYGQADSVRPEAIKGWAAVTSRQFDSIGFEGGHFFIDSSRAAVLEHLRHTFFPERQLTHDTH